MMKYFVAFLFALPLFYSPSANAQNEQWDTYMIQMGTMPASVLVDMSLKATAPDSRYPFLVITGPKTKNCNTRGLMDADEIRVLEEVLDVTGKFITGLTPKILAGTVTRNCQRVNYYYVKDTTGLRTAMRRMYAQNFKSYEYFLAFKSDPQWTSYNTILYPDEETKYWMANDKIITKMLLSGDSLKTQRDINFDFYFKSDSDRIAFLGFAKTKGYNSKIVAANNSNSNTYEAVISSFNFVKMKLVNEMTIELCTEAKKYNALYNGWQATERKIK